MKKCPQCGREYDSSMVFCLDDGTELLYGPARSEPGAIATGFPSDEPQTAILHSTPAPAPGEAPTRAQVLDTNATALLPNSADRFPSQAASRKNSLIAGILGVLLVTALGVGSYIYYGRSSAKQINSIAVMPFENRNSDADTDYLSDGLAESLIYRLSQLPDLKVSPTSSVFRYKGKETDPQAAAKELAVDSVMTGRITQRGDSLTISVNLVDTRNGKSLWGEQYERKLSELLTTQREIVAEIVGKLQLKLSGESEQKLAKTYTTNPQAYQLYLTGKYHQNKLNEEGYKKSIEYYNQALALDPNYALAYVGIGGAYVNAAEWYLPTREAMPKVKIAAQKALELDESLADAHALMTTYENWYGWDWAIGEKEVKRAIELDPNTGHGAYAWHLSINGRGDEAIKEMENEQDLNPLNLGNKSDLVQLYLRGGKTDKALEQARKTVELDQNYAIGYQVLGEALARKQMFPEAVASCEKARSLDNSAELIGYCGYVYALAGNKEKALKAVNELQGLFTKEYAPAYFVAMVYAGLGDKDKAFEWLEKAIINRTSSLLKVEIPFENLRGDPRFKDLLKRMNLPE